MSSKALCKKSKTDVKKKASSSRKFTHRDYVSSLKYSGFRDKTGKTETYYDVLHDTKKTFFLIRTEVREYEYVKVLSNGSSLRFKNPAYYELLDEDEPRSRYSDDLGSLKKIPKTKKFICSNANCKAVSYLKRDDICVCSHKDQ